MVYLVEMRKEELVREPIEKIPLPVEKNKWLCDSKIVLNVGFSWKTNLILKQQNPQNIFCEFVD